MDKIVYTVWTNGGGVDGFDRSDKPKPRKSGFNKELLSKEITNWDQKDLKAEIIDVEQRKKQALAKLDSIDKLVLGLS